MDQVFFRVPFASNGDTSTISETVTADGSVNWPQGWPLDYEKDMDADANAKPVEREVMNFMFNAVTVALRQYQSAAFPEFITAADNNGSAFPYSAGTVVRYRADSTVAFRNYVSLVDDNTATPGTDEAKWQAFIFAEASEDETAVGQSGTLIITPRRLKKVTDELADQIGNSVAPFVLPVGAILQWPHPIPPEGWLECNGQIFDTNENPELYSVCPSGRVPDTRGRFVRGWDNGAGVDPETNRPLGSDQESANKRHSHSLMMVGEHAKSVPDDLILENNISKSAAIYELKDAEKNDQVRFILPEQYSMAMEAGEDESRPTNIALMHIIKTDKAESNQGEAAPTAIVITPATSKLHAGEMLQLSATVLPASIGGDYPVSWTVTDASLGSVNANGEYTSLAGKGGTQTVIASISTGLTATATIDQEIYLTSIEIGAIPAELLVDQSYDIAITYSPQNYSENVLATSSDSSVATLTASGTLFIAGEGTATLALTGASSGVTKSVTVTTKAVEEQPVYLEIANNLSEISEEGESAREEARDHLGLGKLATKDSLNAEDVGAAPMATDSLPQDLDLDKLTTPGDYFQSVSSYATKENHYPEENAGAVRVIATGVSEGACRQFYWPYNSTKEYRRYAYGEPLVFGGWEVF